MKVREIAAVHALESTWHLLRGELTKLTEAYESGLITIDEKNKLDTIHLTHSALELYRNSGEDVDL